MKLSEAVAQYVKHKQSMGMRFRTEQRTLKSFCCSLGDTNLAQIEPEQVRTFLAGTGPVTRFWQRKHEVLLGFYRFAIARGYSTHSPLPRTVPKPSQSFVPYIFSLAELKRLLDATGCCEHPRSVMEVSTCRTLLLLLYGTGPRISEALSLTLADVDLDAGLLQIRDSKFYKTSLVPVGADLRGVLVQYVARRPRGNRDPDAPFFVSRTGEARTRQAAEGTFRRLRLRAEVLRHDGARYQPRLHDLRHSFAVHRLVSWYRAGFDVQRLLPHLATYLGHAHIAATQRYLTLTPELLGEASKRFERYAMGEHHD